MGRRNHRFFTKVATQLKEKLSFCLVVIVSVVDQSPENETLKGQNVFGPKLMLEFPKGHPEVNSPSISADNMVSNTKNQDPNNPIDKSDAQMEKEDVSKSLVIQKNDEEPPEYSGESDSPDDNASILNGENSEPSILIPINKKGKSQGNVLAHSNPFKLEEEEKEAIPSTPCFPLKESLDQSRSDLNISIDSKMFVSLKTGKVTDHYKISNVLGVGAYGKVTRVIHKRTNQERALKAIKISETAHETSEKASRKLFTEASMLKDLDYPNIIKLFDVFKDQKYYYMVTEYCSGGELFEKIQKQNGFSEKMAADYMKQLLSAISYLHSKRICHRDLKPENLLLNSKSPDAKIKLIDFGVSCKFTPGKKMKEKVGTAYYIAPEVLRKSYDEKCDVWSCGVILYIMLCGYPPFAGNSDKEIFSKIKNSSLKFPEGDWTNVSSEAKSLVKRMLEYEPVRRLSAQEALGNKWIQKNTKEKQLDPMILQNLRLFNTKSQLKQAILTFIAVQLSSQTEKDHLEQAFKTFDVNGDGRLTAGELVKGYQSVFKLSKPEAKATVEQILEKIDFDKNSGIDYSEFLVACFDQQTLLSKERLDQAFNMFDLVETTSCLLL